MKGSAYHHTAILTIWGISLDHYF